MMVDGRSIRPRRQWSKEILEPLFRRWRRGESIVTLAKIAETTPTRLTTAFNHYGFCKTKRLGRCERKQVYYGKPQAEPKPAEIKSRFYKGSFDL